MSASTQNPLRESRSHPSVHLLSSLLGLSLNLLVDELDLGTARYGRKAHQTLQVDSELIP
jgi:hypothetical protein